MAVLAWRLATPIGPSWAPSCVMTTSSVAAVLCVFASHPYKPTRAEKKMQTVLHHKEFDPSKFTIVWDLDETLVYAQEWELGSEYFIEFVKRPGVNDLLNQLLAEGFQHAVFTAGTQDYADEILSRFDPMGRYFSNRRFYRHHMVNGKKDLAAVFGPDLRRIVHVDDKALTVVPKEQQKHTILVDAWCGEAKSVSRAVANLNKVAPIARALRGFPPSPPLPCPSLTSCGHNSSMVEARPAVGKEGRTCQGP